MGSNLKKILQAKLSTKRSTPPVKISWGQIGLLTACFLLVFSLQLLVQLPVIGIPFFYLIPITWAAIYRGAKTGAIAGLVAGFFLTMNYLIGSTPEAFIGDVIVKTSVYVFLGYVLGALWQRQVQLEISLLQRKQELSKLRSLQDALTSDELNSMLGVETAACFVPARSGVSGDFFLAQDSSVQGTQIFAIGDAIGKGHQAAQQAIFVRTTIATFSRFVADPARLLELANYSLLERGEQGSFVTALCVSKDSNDQVAIASAGHPPPLRLDGQEVEMHTGLALGIEFDIESQVHRCSLEKGLLLYTDGLPEARNPEGELLNEGKIKEYLKQNQNQDLDQILEGLRQIAEDWSQNGLGDDLCMLALRPKVKEE
jgi:hypothetical protein